MLSVASDGVDAQAFQSSTELKISNLNCYIVPASPVQCSKADADP